MAKLNQFDIVEKLEAFALSLEWSFVLGFTDLDNNLGTFQEYTAGQTVLIVQKQITPTFEDGVIINSTAVCTCMLMRKFDADYDGTNAEETSANIGETAEQKYTRRIGELEQSFSYAMALFACNEGYTVSMTPLLAEVNAFDSNLDGVGSTVTFTLTLG